MLICWGFRLTNTTQDCAQAIAWVIGSPDAEITDWFEDETVENASSSALDDIKDPENATIVGTFLAWRMDHNDDMWKFCILMARLGATESSDSLYKQLEKIDIEEGIALIGKLYHQYVRPYRKQKMN